MENELREQPISSSDLFLQSGSMAFNAEVAETEKEKKRSSARTALLLRAKMCYNNKKAHPKEAFP